MNLFEDVLKFSFIDVIDILLVALLLFYIYKLIKGTAAINILFGIIITYTIWKATKALHLEMLSTLIGKFISLGMFALVVVFQQEIRKFLLMVGSANFNNNRRFIRQLRFSKKESTKVKNNDIETIINTCDKLSKTKTGALIVIERANNLDFLESTGDKMNIQVAQPIIESIFFKNSPLHDGAIIIRNNIIKATRVILPLDSRNYTTQNFGLRHRAAIGITKRTDAISIVVSEETGAISAFKDGHQIKFKNTSELIALLKEDLE